jgi:hypothetical protein
LPIPIRVVRRNGDIDYMGPLKDDLADVVPCFDCLSQRQLYADRFPSGGRLFCA